MRSASMLCSAIAARTAAQRRSSSAVEMGWLMRSDASAIDPPAQSDANLMQFPLLVQGGDACLPFHHIDHSLQVPGEVLAQVVLEHGDREARVAVEEPALVLGDD